MICNFKNIKDIVKKEGLNLLVVSYGGSISNTLVYEMEKNNYKCRTTTWEKILCHCPRYIDLDIPIIYIYDNPIKAFMSMKNRGNGYWDVNQQKLSNNTNVPLSDENLMKLMINQFKSWADIKRSNVLVIKSSELFQHTIVSKLENFLKNKINYFPIQYNNPKTNINSIFNEELNKLFEKYKLKIDKINNFITTNLV